MEKPNLPTQAEILEYCEKLKKEGNTPWLQEMEKQINRNIPTEPLLPSDIRIISRRELQQMSPTELEELMNKK